MGEDLDPIRIDQVCIGKVDGNIGQRHRACALGVVDVQARILRPPGGVTVDRHCSAAPQPHAAVAVVGCFIRAKRAQHTDTRPRAPFGAHVDAGGVVLVGDDMIERYRSA